MLEMLGRYPVLAVIGVLMLVCAFIVLSLVPEVLASTLTAIIVFGVFTLTN